MIRTIGGSLELLGVFLVAWELSTVRRHIDIPREGTLRHRLAKRIHNALRNAWHVVLGRNHAATGTGRASAGAGQVVGVGTATEVDQAMPITVKGSLVQEVAALRSDLRDLREKLSKEVAAREAGDRAAQERAQKELAEAVDRIDARAMEQDGRIAKLEDQIRSSLPVRWLGFVLVLLGLVGTTWSAELARVS